MLVKDLKTIARNPMAFIKMLDLSEYETKIQPKWIHTIHENCTTVFLGRRQCAKTLTLCAYALWYALFNGERNIAVSSASDALTRDMIRMIDDIYHTLPDELKQIISYKKTRNMITINRSKIITAYIPRSERKHDYITHLPCIDLFIVDDFAHWNDKTADAFMKQLFPTLKYRKVVFASTSRGAGTKEQPNAFYTLFSENNGLAKLKYVMNPKKEPELYEKLVMRFGEQFVRREYCGDFI